MGRMTPGKLAREFYLGFREALTCPDVSPAEYVGVMERKMSELLAADRERVIGLIRQAEPDLVRRIAGEIAAEREACADLASNEEMRLLDERANHEDGTWQSDLPLAGANAARAVADAIRARSG